jgi:hypothetical protein
MLRSTVFAQGLRPANSMTFVSVLHRPLSGARKAAGPHLGRSPRQAKRRCADCPKKQLKRALARLKLAVHRRMLSVLHLDPVPRSTAFARAIPTLRYQSFQSRPCRDGQNLDIRGWTISDSGDQAGPPSWSRRISWSGVAPPWRSLRHRDRRSFHFGIRPHVFRRHQPGVVAERLKFATEMMRPTAGLHADQARRQVGKPRFHLATRPFLSKYDRTTAIVPHDVERVFADIDADHGDCAARFLRHGVLLFGAPSQLLSLAGLEQGRTIPFCEVKAHCEMVRLSG